MINPVYPPICHLFRSAPLQQQRDERGRPVRFRLGLLRLLLQQCADLVVPDRRQCLSEGQGTASNTKGSASEPGKTVLRTRTAVLQSRERQCFEHLVVPDRCQVAEVPVPLRCQRDDQHPVLSACCMSSLQNYNTICPPELKVRTPAHTKQLGWYLEFESRVTYSNTYRLLERPDRAHMREHPELDPQMRVLVQQCT